MKLNDLLQKIPKRYILLVLSFFGLFNAFILRSNLSIAIVAMVNPMVEVLSNGTTVITPPVQNWNAETQGVILSSFFYSYIVVQIPASILAVRVGGKIFMGVGIGLCGFLSLFTPLCAQNGSTAMIILRVLQGLCSGFILPSMRSLWTKWAPQCEAGTLISFSTAGSYVGIFFAMFFGGIISQYWSWEWVFNLPGISTIIWTLFWFSFVYESPSVHPTISDQELAYIRQNTVPNFSIKTRVPWKHILLSLPVWATIVLNVATNWPINTMLLELPTYFNRYLNLNLTLTGIWSAVPWLLFAVMIWVAGYTSDRLTKQYKNIYVRIAMVSLSYTVLLMGLLIVILTTKSQRELIIMGIIVVVTSSGPALATFSTNQMEIGGYYSGIIGGLANTFASISGIVIPIFVSAVVTNENSQREWNIIFMSSILICLVAWYFYIVCASDNLQFWARGNLDEYEPILNKSNTDPDVQNQTALNESATDDFGNPEQTDIQAPGSSK